MKKIPSVCLPIFSFFSVLSFAAPAWILWLHNFWLVSHFSFFVEIKDTIIPPLERACFIIPQYVTPALFLLFLAFLFLSSPSLGRFIGVLYFALSAGFLLLLIPSYIPTLYLPLRTEHIPLSQILFAMGGGREGLSIVFFGGPLSAILYWLKLKYCRK